VAEPNSLHFRTEPSAGPKNTNTVRSSVMSKKRCSTARSTKSTVPGPTACCCSPALNEALPATGIVSNNLEPNREDHEPTDQNSQLHPVPKDSKGAAAHVLAGIFVHDGWAPYDRFEEACH
jgi:hypothetical protein